MSGVTVCVLGARQPSRPHAPICSSAVWDLRQRVFLVRSCVPVGDGGHLKPVCTWALDAALGAGWACVGDAHFVTPECAGSLCVPPPRPPPPKTTGLLAIIASSAYIIFFFGVIASLMIPVAGATFRVNEGEGYFRWMHARLKEFAECGKCSSVASS